MSNLSHPAQMTANWGDEKLVGLIAAYLADEDDAQDILADLFEDRGDDVAAKRVRAVDHREHHRLDFALHFMPYRAVLFAGCGFVEHVLPKQKRQRIQSATPFQMLRNWLLNSDLTTELRDAERILSNRKLLREFVEVKTVLQSYCADVLAAAANRAFAAMLQEKHYQRRGMPSTASEHEHNVKYVVSRLAVYCREVAAASHRARRWWRFTGPAYDPREEVAWQVQHTIGIMTGN